ncbi:MAG: serine aminopeptidase domain-containing protein [Promethearchaeota archaeon]
MKSSTFKYKDQDDIEIFVYKWEPDAQPKASVQISHGMAEHAKRYEYVAEILTKNGFIVYADDHRGHGMTAGDLTEATLKGNAGILGPNGWNGTVSSIHELSKIIKKENPNIPLFLLGHSWGSFMAQDIMQQWGNEYDGVILSGTNGRMSNFLLKIAKWIAKKQVKKIGPNTPCEIMDKLSFGSFNKPWKKEPGATGFEWLSRDKEQVKKYIDDPWCGFVAPASFFVELLNGLGKIWIPENEQKIPKDLPLYVFAGKLDPVSRRTKDIEPLLKRYFSYGIREVAVKFYEAGRHEMFNEINRDEVIKDLVDWLNDHL